MKPKGFTIDGNYLYPVAMYMERVKIPKPKLKRPKRKYLTDIDGEIIPIIHIECD